MYNNLFGFYSEDINSDNESLLKSQNIFDVNERCKAESFEFIKAESFEFICNINNNDKSQISRTLTREFIVEIEVVDGKLSNNKDFFLSNSYHEEKRHDSKQNENPELFPSPEIDQENTIRVLKDKKDITFLGRKTGRSQEEESIINDNNNNSIKKEKTNQRHELIQLGGNAEIYKDKETRINENKKPFKTEIKDNDDENLFLREDHKMIKIRTYIFDSFEKYINFLLEIRNQKWNIRNKGKEEKKSDKLCKLEAKLINQNNKIEDNIKLWGNTLEEIYTKNKISAKEKKPFNNNTEIIKSIYKKDKNENDQEAKELRIAFKLKFCELHQIFIKEISHELKEKIVGLKHLNKHFNNLDDFYEYLKIQFCYKNNKFVEKYINEPCIGINDLCLNFYNWFAKKSPKQK